jgi:NhaA family Na+:H+ antiporter
VAATLAPPLDSADHVLGPAGAPYELVMFGDFQCPYCLGAQAVLRRVRERLGDDLRFAFRHFPVSERHPLAQAAAEAAEAAAAQGAFWPYHDALYAAQGRLTGEAVLPAIARELGLDGDRVARELRDGTWRDRVARDVESAQASGVRGTPAFFAGGQRHEDAYDASSLVAALVRGATPGVPPGPR